MLHRSKPPDRGQPEPKTARDLRPRGSAPCLVSGGRPPSRRCNASPAGQRVSDFARAAALLSALPSTKALLADRGYDANWLRDALADRKIAACAAKKSTRKIQIPHDKLVYRKRHKIANMFGKLKDWRRIHTRFDRCAHTFMSAIAIAAIVIFWI